MEFIAAASLILGAAGAATQATAAGAAAKTARENERLAKMETEEQARRMKLDQDNALGLATARAAASGLDQRPGDSQSIYLDQFEKEQRRELSWLRTAGASRADILGRQGRTAATQGYAGAVGTLASSVGSYARVGAGSTTGAPTSTPGWTRGVT